MLRPLRRRGIQLLELLRDRINGLVGTGIHACLVAEGHFRPRHSVARQARRPVAT